jgi:hypothetical protein
MRHETQADDIQRFMERLGRAVREPGRVYFTGGVSALLHGWREMTVDIDPAELARKVAVFTAS